MEKLYGSLSQEFQLNGTLQNEEVFNGNLANEVLRGYSAYQVAVLNGFIGTEKEWLDSLKYQHSTELTELASQVRNDAIQVNNDKLQVSKDKETIELKAQEVNSSALSVSQNKSHIDNSVMEFNNKVAQANTTIDTKVEQASASANLSKQSATQSQNYSNVSASYVSQVSQDKAYIDTEIRKFNTTISQTKSEIEQNATSVESTKQQVSSLANQVKTDAQSSALSCQNAKVSETNAKASEEKAKASEVIAKTNADNSSASAIQAENAKNIAIQNATKIEQSASQIQQNKNDILNFSIKNKASGNPCIITDSQDYKLLDLKIYGQSEQNGVPSPDAPIPIVHKSVSGIRVTGKNLLPTDDSVDLDVENYCVGKTKGIYLHKGINYVLSMNETPTEMSFLNFNDVVEKKTSNRETLSFIPQDDGLYYVKVYVSMYNTGSGVTNFHKETLRLNIEKDLGNEKPKEQIVVLTPPKTLTKFDSIQKINGVWSYVYRQKEFVITGNEEFRQYNADYWTGSSTSAYVMLSRDCESNTGNFMERLPERSGIWSSRNSIGFTFNLVGDYQQLHIRLPNTILGVDDLATKEEKYQAYINHLKSEYNKGTPYKVFYQSNKTEIIPLSKAESDALDRLRTYTPYTTIDAQVPIEVEYCADTKLYIDQSISKYHAQAQANQVAMMSLLPDETQATMIEKDQQNLLKGV